ncbi:MAM and LDL-receptor class A domain-containing protein 2-like [Acanthaster planci]|uniref:MAM and LDL-receptor class A domain-containing protein 2-like n=1 Tax=Acanthaster planci TaxID=133434 RepID=A0A8B7ZI60_ACAPL|nr:MAM and LDL-receptor class A domain-containing protein 2-like [Acanthaster planci]
MTRSEAGILLILALNAAVASGGMSRLFEDLLPYYCEDSEDVYCRHRGLADPRALLLSVLRKQAELQDANSGSIPQQSSPGDPIVVDIECDFNPSSLLPIPFLCGWSAENNDDINWEPGSILYNGLTGEEGPLALTAYANSILNTHTLTTPATASLLTPVIDGSTDDIIFAVIGFQYNLRGTQDNCKLELRYLRKDGARLALWSSVDEFITGRWVTVELSEVYPPIPFQLAFESTLSPGATTKPFAAVDDVKLQVGALPLVYDCEGGTLFADTCGFFDVDGRWSRWSGFNASAEGKGPKIDHTLGTSSGHFLINVNTRFSDGEARLRTPYYYRWSSEATCTLRLYYHAKTSGDMGVSVSDASGREDVFPVLLDYTETWVEHDIDLTSVIGKYRITINVTTSTGDDNYIAIDDVQFLEDECRGRRFCSSYPCLNNGICWQTSPEDFRCNCTKEFEGFDCSINVDECSRDPTLCAYDSDRICQDASPGYQCVCKPGTMEYNGKCIEACTETTCTRKYEVCLQNDNAFSCQCQYGYVESGDGECIRDKSEVKSGVAPYTSRVILGTYLGGSLLAVVVAALVVVSYFALCDEDEDGDEWKPDRVEANRSKEADAPYVSGLGEPATSRGQ